MRALVWAIGPADLSVNGAVLEMNGAPRSAGNAVLAKYQEQPDVLRVPALDATIRYLRDVGQPPHQVILVVTDQPDGASGREQDTCALGTVVDKYLREQYDFQKPPRTWRLRCPGSSLDDVSREMTTWLGALDREYDAVYLVMNLAVAAIATALLLGALDMCPDRLGALDVLADGEVRPMDIVRKVRVGAHCRDIRTALLHGRFGAAHDLVPRDAEEIGLPGYAHRTLLAVLESADQRLRFDLDGARQSLAKARREAALPAHLYQQVTTLRRWLPENDDPAALLRELYYNADQQLRHAEYADFVLRLFNFQQAALRQTAEKGGVRFIRKGEYLDPAWLQTHPRFEEFAACWPSPGGGKGVRLDEGRATGPVLLCLAGHLHVERRIPRDILDAALCIQSVVDLRNRCFAAHDFGQVTWEDIATRLKGDRRDILDVMWVLYAGATGQDIGRDPFDGTAHLSEMLLKVTA